MKNDPYQRRRVLGHQKDIKHLSNVQRSRLIDLREAELDARDAYDAHITKLYLEGVSQKSIADALGITQKAVSIRIARRRARISGETP